MVLAAVAAVAVSLPFEGALMHVRQEVQALQQSLATATRIRSASRDLRNAGWNARRARQDLQMLRNRMHRPQDPFLRSEAQRLVWNLRELNRQLWRIQSETSRLARESSKDPELVAPAEELDREARDLRSETRWLETDGRWAGMDLRRAGLSMEAWDVERETQETERWARDLEWDARTLLDKVR